MDIINIILFILYLWLLIDRYFIIYKSYQYFNDKNHYPLTENDVNTLDSVNQLFYFMNIFSVATALSFLNIILNLDRFLPFTLLLWGVIFYLLYLGICRRFKFKYFYTRLIKKIQ